MNKTVANKAVKGNKEVKGGLINRMLEAVESGSFDKEFDEWIKANLI